MGGLVVVDGHRRSVCIFAGAASWPAIEAWQHRPRPGMQVEQQYVVQVGSDASAVAMPVNYLLYLPPDYTWHKKWPLVVYLHGSGSRGQDLNLVRREGPAGLVEHGKKFRFHPPFAPMSSNSWWEPEVVVGLIEHISSSLSVDRDRVYLTGYSMGGFGGGKRQATIPVALQPSHRCVAVAM